METIRDRLLKIMALAESGIAGEKQNARKILSALCLKHHIRPETLLSPIRTLYDFSHRGGRDGTLLVMCAICICGKTSQCRFTRKKLVLKCTRAESIDVADMIRHYRKAWRSDLDDFFFAFINRHKLVLPSSDSDPGPEISPARLERLLNFMRGIQSETWIRPVARLTVMKQP